MITGKNKPLIQLTIVLLLLSCGKNVVFTDSESMPSKTWDLENRPLYNIKINDTISNHNIYFILRTGSSYPFRNIYLFVTTTSPDARSVTDTLEYDLADEKGRWYGKGFGDIHEMKLPYRSNVFFPVSGIYQINVQHGMRTRILNGVYDFGVMVEKVPKQGK